MLNRNILRDSWGPVTVNPPSPRDGHSNSMLLFSGVGSQPRAVITTSVPPDIETPLTVPCSEEASLCQWAILEMVPEGSLAATKRESDLAHKLV